MYHCCGRWALLAATFAACQALSAAAECMDTDNGARDGMNFNCADHARVSEAKCDVLHCWCTNPEYARFDDSDFTRANMCCACGGGTTTADRQLTGGTDTDTTSTTTLTSTTLSSTTTLTTFTQVSATDTSTTETSTATLTTSTASETSQTSTSSQTSTTSFTAIRAKVVSQSASMTVDDPATFATDPNVNAALTTAFANLASVSESQVVVTITADRRLHQGRQLTSGTVTVDAEITVVSSSSDPTAADDVSTNLGSVTTSSLASEASTQLTNQGVSSSISVQSLAAPVTTEITQTVTTTTLTTTTTETTFTTVLPTPAPTAAPSVGSVAGDPVTTYGDVRADFVLPIGRWTPMLVTPEFSLLAWPMPGPGDEQWIGHVAVLSPAGEILAHVLIKEDLADSNKTLPRDAFHTLDVGLGPARVPLRKLPSTTVVGVDSFSMHGVELAFGRVRGSRFREWVAVLTDSAKVLIVSTSAREFYGDHSDLAYRFAHLDLEVFDLQRPERFQGALPELWGLRPLSGEIAGLMKPYRQAAR